MFRFDKGMGGAITRSTSKPLINRGLFFCRVQGVPCGPFEPEVFEFPRPMQINFDAIIDLLRKRGDRRDIA